MRVLLPTLFLLACAAPPEECRMQRALTDDEARRPRYLLVTSSPDCVSGFCLQDQPDASVGTCARPCELTCPAGTVCTQVDQQRLCLP